MINLPQDTYTRITVDNDIWIVVYVISATIAICVREVDVNGGASAVPLVLMEI